MNAPQRKRFRQTGGYVHLWFVIFVTIGGIMAAVGYYPDRPAPAETCETITRPGNAGPEWDSSYETLQDTDWNGCAP